MKNICDTCALNPSASLKPLGEEAGAYHYTIALAGNPNTGKSTVFNALTGLRQHTGNWPGKTVTRAEGSFSFHDQRYRIIDLPGTYSLLSTSEDEEVARDFILFGKPDVTVIVVDASRLERNLSLALQILEITDKAVLCLNLMDEARRHHITIDTRTLSRDLGIPVVATSARTKEGIPDLLFAIEEVVSGKFQAKKQTYIDLPKENAEAIAELQSALSELNPELPNTRWLAMRLIEGDESVQKGVEEGTFSAENNPEKQSRVLCIADEYHKILGDSYRNDLVEAIYAQATTLINASVSTDFSARSFRVDRAIDRVVTHKIWGFPIMFLLLAGVLCRVALSTFERRSQCLALPLVAQWFPHRWGVFSHHVGDFGDVAPNGYLLSAIHPPRRFWLLATCGFQFGQALPHCRRSRQTSPHDEYGLWL